MKKRVLLSVTLLLLSSIMCLYGCGGGSGTSTGTVPVVVVTATPIVEPTITPIPYKTGNISGQVFTNTGTGFSNAFVVFQSILVSEKIESSGAFTRTTSTDIGGNYVFINVPQGPGNIYFWSSQSNYQSYPNNPLGSVNITVTDNTNGVNLQQGQTTQSPTPAITSTPTPGAITGSINIGYIKDDRTVDWNATITSNKGMALFEGVIPEQSYTITTSFFSGGTSKTSNIVAHAGGVITNYYIYRSPGWSSTSKSGIAQLSGYVRGMVSESNVMRGVNVQLISETTGQALNSTTGGQYAEYNFSSIPIGYYTLVTDTDIKSAVYHYPVRTDVCRYDMKVVSKWETWAGSSHPYNPNKGYLLITAVNSEADLTPISGATMAIQKQE